MKKAIGICSICHFEIYDKEEGVIRCFGMQNSFHFNCIEKSNHVLLNYCLYCNEPIYSDDKNKYLDYLLCGNDLIYFHDCKK